MSQPVIYQPRRRTGPRKGLARAVGSALWKIAEGDQGYAFISDAVEVYDDQFVFEIARGSLYHSERYVRRLKAWLKRHGQLHGIAKSRQQ